MSLERKAMYNIVIAGKSGVGKTSLLNYLFGSNAGLTGVGKPVTERGFHATSFMIKDLPVTIFDTWGIEINKAEQWKDILEKELSKRGVDKSPEVWFHTIIYCVQVGGSRIEDFEIGFIKEFIERKYKVIVLLTKADQGGKKDIEELTHVLHKEISDEIKIVPLCSVNDVRLDGSKIKAFGRTDIFECIHKDFWNSIKLRLPERCVAVLICLIDESMTSIMSNAKIARFNFASRHVTNDLIKREFEKLRTDLEGKNGLIVKTVIEEVKRTMNLYGLFSKAIATVIQGESLDIDFSLKENIFELHKYDYWDLLDRFFNFDNLDFGLDIWWDEIKDMWALISGDDSAWRREVKREIESSGSNIKERLKSVKPKIEELVEILRSGDNFDKNVFAFIGRK